MAGNDFEVLNKAFPTEQAPPPAQPGMLERAKGYGIGILNKVKGALGASPPAVDPNNPLKGLGLGEAPGKKLVDRNDYQLRKQMGEVP